MILNFLFHKRDEERGLILNKNNYILLGMAISYMLIAIIQVRIDGLLPAAVYVTIAFVSLEFTLFEMTKSMIGYSINIMKKMNMNLKLQAEIIEKSMKIYNKFGGFDNEIQTMKNELKILLQSDKSTVNNIQIKRLEKIRYVISCIQVIICTVQIMIAPLKVIPYDKLTNKVINVITIISFAFMFLSYFFEDFYNSPIDYEQERQHIYEGLFLTHLKGLEKITSHNENKQEI